MYGFPQSGNTQCVAKPNGLLCWYVTLVTFSEQVDANIPVDIIDLLKNGLLSGDA